MSPNTPIRRVFLHTLGCPKNEVDSTVLSRSLVGAGLVMVDNPDDADIEIINTCGFIEATKLESLEAIWEAVERRGQKQTSSRRLIVTGCLAQRYGDQLAADIDGIDAIVGFDRPDLVLQAIDAEQTGAPACWIEKPGQVFRDDRTQPWLDGQKAPISAYIKIADGCDNACRFCAIPLIRGRMRSRPASSIISEIRALVAAGTCEVILVAQDTTSWGNDLGDGSDLAGLLRSINAIEGDFWIRLMYAHPAFLTDNQIAVMAVCEKMVPYVDMPLQHASDRMLTLMNRHITRAGTQDRIDRLRSARNDMVLRTTFIVGHPGETDADFDELMAFAEANSFERLGVFPYSGEEGTPSVRLDGAVPPDVTQARVARLTEAYDVWSAEQSVDKVGCTVRCLVERCRKGRWEGRTIYDAPEIDGRVIIEGPVPRPGLYDIELTQAMGVDFYGRLAGRDAVDRCCSTSDRTGGEQ